MEHGKRIGIALAAACCLVAGAAFGGSLLNAGAATPATSASGSPARGSNETKSHEAGESAAREAAENNGTADYGPRGDHDGGFPNEDPSHEAAESAAREAQEHSGASTPDQPEAGSTSGSSGT